jgi:hypothetical protein
MPPLARWGSAAADPATANLDLASQRHSHRAVALTVSVPESSAAAATTPTGARQGSTTTVPSFPVHSQAAAAGTDPTYDLVLVGGVPGAGKTTAIARATDDLDCVRAIDPEHVTWWLRRRLPEPVPYRAYRWLVHLLHTLRVLVHLLNGPVAGRRLVVHDPGTRIRRRSLFLGLAHLAGWRAVLLYVDVDRSAAQIGQLRRGRVVRSFEEHWESWQHLRPSLDAAARDLVAADGPSSDGSDPILLVERTEAADVLRRLCVTS